MILITGANGQLGYDFQRLFNELKIDFLATDFQELDITNLEKICEFVQKNIVSCGKKLTAIINCAAYNAVDKAEEEVEKCYKLNAFAPWYLAKIAKEFDVDFITYSTDFVFSGEKGTSYNENDEPAPLSVYSRSKREGEILVLREYPRSFLVRTSWVFGIANNNFNKQVLAWAENKEALSIFDDQFGSPTYSKDLAFYSWKLMQTKKYGIYHIANKGIASKYDQAKYILDKTNWRGELLRGKTSDIVLPAKRPKMSPLDITKIEQTLNLQIPSWKDSINRYLLDK